MTINLSLNKIIHHFTNKIHNLSRNINQNTIKNKIQSILSNDDLSTKLIYKIIKNKKEFNQINYVVTSETPPKIEPDPDKISEFIFQHYNNTFSNNTEPKPLNYWLNHTPSIPFTDHSLPLISSEITKNILSHKTSTAPGPDLIKYDIFKFLALHNSCIFDILSTLYTKMIQFCYIPNSWKQGSTILLPKPDNNFFNNWRPITLLNTLYKGLTTIINDHIQSFLTNNQLLPKEQCGFNKNKDTSTAIITYLETIKLTKNLKIPLHSIYIDFKAAFDSVQHWTIASILTHIKINPTLKDFILYIMSNCHTKFISQNLSTPPVHLKKGVKQGNPLSPTLFLIYLLPLQWFLIHNNKKSISNINHLCYADDMLLIAHSRNEIENMFGNLAIYTYYTDMSINNSKSQYTYINDSPQPNFQMNITNNNNTFTISLPTEKKDSNYKYLGLNINLDLNFSPLINTLIEKYKNTICLIMNKKYLGLNLIIKLINTVAIPKIAYSMNFIKWLNQLLDDLDNFNISTLCQKFQYPNISPNGYWFLIKKLLSIKEINFKRYLSSHLDRTMEDDTTFKVNITSYNHIIKPIYMETYIPPTSHCLKNLNIEIIKTNQNPSQSINIIA